MGKCSKIEGMDFRKEGGGENFEKKNANVINAIRKLIYVGSLIQIRQWENFKNRGDFWEMRGIRGTGKFEKKCTRHKCHPKMNMYRKFHPNHTMEKC